MKVDGWGLTLNFYGGWSSLERKEEREEEGERERERKYL